MDKPAPGKTLMFVVQTVNNKRMEKVTEEEAIIAINQAIIKAMASLERSKIRSAAIELLCFLEMHEMFSETRKFLKDVIDSEDRDGPTDFGLQFFKKSFVTFIDQIHRALISKYGELPYQPEVRQAIQNILPKSQVNHSELISKIEDLA